MLDVWDSYIITKFQDNQTDQFVIFCLNDLDKIYHDIAEVATHY